MEKRVYYHDTDCGGIVYYARYLEYLEEARTEYLEDRGLSVKSLIEQNFLYAVRSCHIVYKYPARYGDILLCSARLVRMTGVQLVFVQEVVRKIDGRLVAEAEVVLVCLDKDMRPCALTDDMKDKLR